MRDGFQCVITKVYDSHSTTANDELQGIVEKGGVPPAVTHCAHIFPESTNVNITPGSDKVGFLPLPNVDVVVSLGCSRTLRLHRNVPGAQWF